MTENVIASLRDYEGEQVTVSLGDGTRLDDCHLVSCGRTSSDNLWLFVDGSDIFVPRRDVVDVCQADATRAA